MEPTYESKYLTFRSEINDTLMIYYENAHQALLQNLEFACQSYIRKDRTSHELEVEFFQENDPCDKDELSELIQSEVRDIQHRLIAWARNN